MNIGWLLKKNRPKCCCCDKRMGLFGLDRRVFLEDDAILESGEFMCGECRTRQFMSITLNADKECELADDEETRAANAIIIGTASSADQDSEWARSCLGWQMDYAVDIIKEGRERAEEKKLAIRREEKERLEAIGYHVR